MTYERLETDLLPAGTGFPNAGGSAVEGEVPGENALTVGAAVPAPVAGAEAPEEGALTVGAAVPVPVAGAEAPEEGALTVGAAVVDGSVWSVGADGTLALATSEFAPAL